MTWFCIGFFAGCFFNYICSCLKGRRIVKQLEKSGILEEIIKKAIDKK